MNEQGLSVSKEKKNFSRTQESRNGGQNRKIHKEKKKKIGIRSSMAKF